MASILFFSIEIKALVVELNNEIQEVITVKMFCVGVHTFIYNGTSNFFLLKPDIYIIFC